MIDITKSYKTRDGRNARILAIDVKSHSNPVVAAITNSVFEEAIISYTLDGAFYSVTSSTSPNDLIEYNPAEELVLDQAIWVKTSGGWAPRHFARLYDGKVRCWAHGTTSHSSENGATHWDEWRTTKPGEDE